MCCTLQTERAEYFLPTENNISEVRYIMPFTLERPYIVTNEMKGNSGQRTLGWNIVWADRNINNFCLPPAPFWLPAATYFSNADKNVCSSVTSVNFCQTSWCYTSEERNHHCHRFKRVKLCNNYTGNFTVLQVSLFILLYVPSHYTEYMCFPLSVSVTFIIMISVFFARSNI